MVKLINGQTGTEMWVAEDREAEYMKLGHKKPKEGKSGKGKSKEGKSGKGKPKAAPEAEETGEETADDQ